MQQNWATLIYDLNTMKGTVESYLKELAQPFKTVQFQAWKIAPSSKSLKKKNRKLFWATYTSGRWEFERSIAGFQCHAIQNRSK